MSLLQLLQSKVSASRRTAREIQIWSSPERRSGHRLLDPIPNEIYLHILSHFELRKDSSKGDKKRLKDLRSLSLVCRFFCVVTLPRVFESVLFSPIKDGMSFGPFCVALNQGETFAHSLALAIKCCTFRDWYNANPNPDPGRNSFLKTHTRALSSLLSVTNLVISRTPLAAIKNIRKLPHLSSLTLDCCDFGGVTMENVQKLVSEINLQEFRLFLRDDCHINRPSESIIKEFLPLLMNLTKFGTDSWTLVEAVISSDTTPTSLQTLEALTVEDPLSFCEYLYRLPILTSLTLGHFVVLPRLPGAQPAFTISLSRLQNLRHLICSPQLVPHLQGPHELTTLSFSSQADSSLSNNLAPTDSWSDISWCKSINELCLPLAFVAGIAASGRLASSRTSLNNLKKLTIYGDDSSFIEAMFKIITDHVWLSLEEIVLTGGFFLNYTREPSSMRKLLESLRNDHFPELIYVTCHVTDDDQRLTWSRRHSGDEWYLVEDY